MYDGIVTGYERVVITTGQSYNIVPQWEKTFNNEIVHA